MRRPIQVEAKAFFEFIQRPGLVVVLLSVHPLHPFNSGLLQRFEDEYGDSAALGTVGLLELITSFSPALPFLANGLQECGVSSVLDILPGYYLFCDGKMLAWESGLPARSDALQLLRGSLLGALFSAVTRNVSYVSKALLFTAEEVTAGRMAERFRHLFAEHRARPRSHARASTEDEVLRAYRILGLHPEASEREINAAWRALRRKLHPDRAAADPVEFERLSRLSVELNRAREVILDQRARAWRDGLH